MRGQERPFLSWIGVARASITLGDLQTAELAIGQAMQNQSGSAESVDLVARTMLMIAQARGDGGRGQAMMADALFRQAERIEPDLPKLAYHRGLAHLAANDPGVAAALLERAAAADPQDANALQALLIAWERSGQAARGRDLIETLRRENRLPPSMALSIESAAAVSRPSGTPQD
jgi:predicted Zn-dependent protease